MATTKTIQPTGTTITVPAMSDRPDASVFATDISRITDAVNAENTALGKFQSSLGIVSNNNTHVALYPGQYVYVKNHATLAEGIYQANTSIAANVALSSVNLDTISTGGLNSLNFGGQIPNNTDLNDVVIPGCYFMPNGYAYINAPAGLSALIVEKGKADVSAVLQIGFNTTQIYFRFRTSATAWDSWRPVTNPRKWLDDGTDLDDVTMPGWYGISGANSFDHLPTGVASGMLEVIGPSILGSYGIQRLTSLSGTYEYIRYRGNDSGTSWGPWRRLSNQNKLGSFSSISALNTALSSLGATLSDGDVTYVSFTGSSGIEAPLAATNFGGIFYRSNSTRQRVLLLRSGWYPVINGILTDEGWKWENFNVAKTWSPSWDTTKVETGVNGTYLSVKQYGRQVYVGGGFVAKAAIGVSAVTIGAGFPKATERILGSFVAMNTTTKKPLTLAIDTDGKLITYYSGDAIAVGEAVRFSCSYPTGEY